MKANRYALRGSYKKLLEVLGTVPISEEVLARELATTVKSLRKSLGRSRQQHRPFTIQEERYYWLDSETLAQVRERFLELEARR